MKHGTIEYAFYFFTILIFIVFSLFLFRFLSRERENNELYMQYSIERTLFTLYEAYREERLEAAVESIPALKGFGIYRPEGNNRVIVGSAPLMIRPEELMRGGMFRRDSERGTITMIRPIGGGSEPPPMQRRGEHHKMREPRRFRLIYIEMEAGEYFERSDQQRLFTFLYPFLLVAFISSLLILFRKNIRYKKRMEEQKHLAQLGEVSRTLSHEMKNPLGAIRLQTGYLKKLLPPEYGDEMAVIEEETERLKILSDRIGDFLRDPKGHVESIDIIPFIEHIIARFDGRISFIPGTSVGISINFDSQRLRSVLENLIKNGLESGGVGESCEVEIGVTEDRGRVILAIRDNGRGLPDGKGETLFDPFFTTKTKGSGIGLSISKRFVEAAGGRLKLRNRAEGGAEAIIELKKESR